MSKKTDRPTYALGMYGPGALVMRLAENGVEFEQASPEVTRRAVRLGVHCLNSGLDESKLVEMLHEATL